MVVGVVCVCGMSGSTAGLSPKIPDCGSRTHGTPTRSEKCADKSYVASKSSLPPRLLLYDSPRRTTTDDLTTTTTHTTISPTTPTQLQQKWPAVPLVATATARVR